MEVKLENLSKVFVGKKGEKTVAVNQVNLTIPDGKLVGLLGPSGCGKSTTLYLISGLHKATEGKIFFGDQEVTNLPPENRGIGLVFQNYALYPHFTVKQNIKFPLENVDPKLTDKQMDEIVLKMAKLVDIEKLLNRKPKELSGGQQQRVAIARALAKTPRVLLLDEPLSNLDARLRLQTREEIKRIQRETGITTIFVTHDQEEAMSISDLMIVMKDGVIQQIDEPQTIYDEPANLFVAKFLGVPAINTFTGLVKDGKLYIQDVEMATGISGVNRTIIVGVRPESFALEKNRYPFIKIKVSFIEHVGRDISVIGSIASMDKDVRIIVPLEFKASIQENLVIPFSPKRLYLFEENGQRIQ
jgi:multiple sugar transport system ATP-binding protein